MSLLIAVCLAAGLAGMVGVGQRVGLIEGVTARSGELAVATQRLYRALSDADATAASAFLSNGLEPPALRERYQADIADAASALAVVSSGGVRRAQGAVATITTQLPVYTGLIETARTYNRQGLPVGTAYLQEASGLMRGKLLPAAQEVFDIVATDLDEARDRASAFPWFALLLGLGTLGGLVWAQRYLTGRTNRVFNLGLVGATAAALLLVGWLGVSALSAAGRLDASRDDGSAQVNLISKARIAALQARTDEALTLVARGNGAAFEEDYTAVMRRLIGEDGNGGLLAEGRAGATDETTRQALISAAETGRDWDAAHRELRELDGNGQYAEAVAAAVGVGDGSTASIFNRLDAELGRAVDHNGRRFDDEMARAGDRLFGADVAAGVLALLAVIGIAVGFQRRIVEYR